MGNTLCCLKRNAFDDDFEVYKKVDKPLNDCQRGILTKNASEALHPKLLTDINFNDKPIDDGQFHLVGEHSNAKRSASVTVSSDALMTDSDSLANDENDMWSPPAFLSVPCSIPCERYLSAAELTNYESAEEDEYSVNLSFDVKFTENSDEIVQLPDIDAELLIERVAESSVDIPTDDLLIPAVTSVAVSNWEPSDTASTPPVPSLQFKIPLAVDARKKQRFAQDQVVICDREFAGNQPTPSRSSAQVNGPLSGDDRQIRSLPTPLRDNLLSPTRKVEELCDSAGRPLADTPTRKYFDQKRPKFRP